MANVKRDAAREAFWRRVVQRQANSGLSVRAFCRQETLAEANFYAWRRTIARRDQEQVSPAKRGEKAGRSKSSPAFVPVAIHDRSEHGAGIAERIPGIVVEWTNGLRLRFDESIAPDRLAAIVQALDAEATS